jgi:hypothetical protein
MIKSALCAALLLTQVLPDHPNVARLSAEYLGRPYSLGPLGEGPQGTISTRPLWDDQRFDCTTYVETVLARLYATDAADRACVMRQIRYRDGRVEFLERRHLADADWMPHQRAIGVLEDVTTRVGGAGLAREIRTTVNRADWIKSLDTNVVKRDVTAADKAALLEDLRARAAGAGPIEVRVPYLPLAELARAEVQAHLPSGAVFNIVRRSPTWIVAGQPRRMETVISHQGFLIRKNGRVYARSASPRKGGKVGDVLLSEYLGFLAGVPEVVGLNVMVPRARPADLCPR